MGFNLAFKGLIIQRKKECRLWMSLTLLLLMIIEFDIVAADDHTV
jgi:hypothetical protein